MLPPVSIEVDFHHLSDMLSLNFLEEVITHKGKHVITISKLQVAFNWQKNKRRKKEKKMELVNIFLERNHDYRSTFTRLIK